MRKQRNKLIRKTEDKHEWKEGKKRKKIKIKIWPGKKVNDKRTNDGKEKKGKSQDSEYDWEKEKRKKTNIKYIKKKIQDAKYDLESFWEICKKKRIKKM